MVEKLTITLVKSGSSLVASTTLPASSFLDSDIAQICSYLASRYDILSFSSVVCDSGLDRSLSFRIKGDYFDVDRFLAFLKSL